MSISEIKGLRADIVPHSQWAISKWFYANPLWYYHRRGTDEEIVPSKKFYQLVDTDLRELCHLLNTIGVHTTPSCEGHFYERDRFEAIWKELKREEPLIQGQGLRVKDSETDREFLFRDEEYRLPWNSFDEFYAAAADHQGTGYMGIVVPEEMGDVERKLREACRKKERSELVFDEELSKHLRGATFDLFVRTTKPVERAEQWMLITDQFREMFKQERERAA